MQMGVWFALAERPLNWADKARGEFGWNAQAGAIVWRSKFHDVHDIMWRCLLIFALFTVCRLLSAAAGKALALQFHESNHWERMEVWSLNKLHGLAAQHRLLHSQPRVSSVDASTAICRHVT